VEYRGWSRSLKEDGRMGGKILSEADIRSMMEAAGFSDISFTYKKGFGIAKNMIVRVLK
jgi:hypothetical protein